MKYQKQPFVVLEFQHYWGTMQGVETDWKSLLENYNYGQAFFQIDLLMNRVEINEGFNSIAEEKLPGLSIGHQKKLISIGKAGIL